MTDVAALLAAAIGLFIVILLGWWLFIASEGVYLGRRMVIFLYDRFAPRYDNVKGYKRELEHRYLAQPLMSRIAPNRDPLVLDIATGTGRLPLALIRYAHFQGRVIGIDLSVKMLQHGSSKFTDQPRVLLLHAAAEHLPFLSSAFDVVTMLEALEFIVEQRTVFAEIARVLKPGGLLLITNRINTRFMPRKTFTNEQLVEILFAFGFDDVEIEKWQLDYDRVWARKPAQPSP